MKRATSNPLLDSWPSLPYETWKDTLDTLHMWMQIVGKVKLALSPFLNQWWEMAFFVTSRGMTSGNIPYNDMLFNVDFDLSVTRKQSQQAMVKELRLHCSL